MRTPAHALLNVVAVFRLRAAPKRVSSVAGRMDASDAVFRNSPISANYRKVLKIGPECVHVSTAAPSQRTLDRRDPPPDPRRATCKCPEINTRKY